MQGRETWSWVMQFQVPIQYWCREAYKWEIVQGEPKGRLGELVRFEHHSEHCGEIFKNLRMRGGIETDSDYWKTTRQHHKV